jgi:hypothetical protein
MTHEWLIRTGTARPDPAAMSDFNVLTFNSKVFPATAPLVVEEGARVRLRFGNLSAMDHHPIHFHGVTVRTVATDGGAVPRPAQHDETTILVPVGSTRTVELDARRAGDWAIHCHMTHHVMTQMGHAAPSMVGVDRRRVDAAMRGQAPGYMTMGAEGMGGMGDMGMAMPAGSTPMRGGPGPHGTIDMGGMFTIMKVRRKGAATGDGGWYASPPEEQARVARPEELAADGIDLPRSKPQ